MSDRPVALVTGGAKRVGRATARALAIAGCDLIITYRLSDRDAESARQEFESLGAATRCVRMDLDNLEQANAAVAAIAQTAPRLDVLVHNASTYHPTPVERLSARDAESLYRVNALAPLLTTARLATLLGDSPLPGGGAVVAMADIHAFGRPRKGFAAYSMAKAALIEMVRSLSRDLAPRVRVNAVAPGVVAWPDEGYESDEDSQKAYLSRVPLDRAGTPDDAAEAVRWLALDAHYTTGHVLRVDGGRFLA
ncbi:MAG: SDR family oxidoreductase [Planctomycetota bacterium]